MVNAVLAAVVILAGPVANAASSASPPVELTHRVLPTEPGLPQSSPEATLTIPAQTEAAVELLSGIHTKVSHVGDPVTARLLRPVYIDGRVALPIGSMINGRITSVRTAGRLRRPGELSLRFERITLPDGQDEPIAAGLASLDGPALATTRIDSEGHLRGTKGFSWKGVASGLIGLGTLTTIQLHLVSAAALGATLPLGGGAVLGCAFLLPRGNDVLVPPDTRFRIRLHHPLTIRVDW